MPRVLTRVVLGILAGVLVLAFVLLAFLPGGSVERAESSFSTEKSGLRAAYLLLQGLGFDVAPWDRAPGGLQGRGELLFLAELPDAPPAGPPPLPGADGAAPVPAPRSRDLHHYRRFLDEGGTLLVTGVQEDQLEFLRDALGLEGLAGLASEEISDAETTLVLAGDEELELAQAPVRRLTGLGEGDEPLARASDGSVVALARAAGAGRLLLLTLPASVFDNGSLEKGDGAARLLVRLVEAAPGAERILFDEYALGGWRPASALGLAFSPRFLPWIAHLLLLFVVLLWRGAWSGPFARDPEALLALSPFARAQGMARVLARAGRFDTLARLLTQGTLERWAARAGMRLAPQRGEALAPAAVEAELRVLTRGDERLFAYARDCLLGTVPDDEAGLARLDANIAGLGRALFPRGEFRKTPRHIGTRSSGTRS